MTLPVGVISSVLGFVLLTTFSKLQSDTERLRASFLRHVRLSTLLVYPLLGVMIVTASELITGLYGPRWTTATAAFQLLCLGGFFGTVNTLFDALIKAKGAVYRHSLRQFGYAATVVAGSAVGSRWSISGAAVGVDVALVVTHVLLAKLALSLVRLRGRDLLLAQTPGLLLALTVAAVAYLVRTGLLAIGTSDILVAGATAFAGATVGLAVVLGVPWRPMSEASGLLTGEAGRILAVTRRSRTTTTPAPENRNGA
jgi:O-antigen/teichoic acid export membrane protein